jgi:hypothetical protein
VADSFPLLIQVLRKPEIISGFSATDWNVLIQQARAQQLLGRLAVLFEQKGLTDQIPQQPLHHLNAMLKFSQAQCKATQWEITQIENSLAELGTPVVILKGAAYCAAELPFARGRVFSDIDILVARERIQDVEQALLDDGWIGSHHNKYDQRYYREWMHEIPPMQHPQRKTLLDVHHNIVPLTGKIKIDSSLLLQDIVKLPANHFQEIYRLADVDMLLHSILHMTLDGEFNNGLRDLVDIASMMEYFSQDHDFMESLPTRAKQLDAENQLCYALQLCVDVLAINLPGTVAHTVSQHTSTGLSGRLMRKLLKQVMLSAKPFNDPAAKQLAHWLLFTRSHYLKMPLHLLLPHLVIKTLTSLKEQEDDLPKEVLKYLKQTRRP